MDTQFSTLGYMNDFDQRDSTKSVGSFSLSSFVNVARNATHCLDLTGGLFCGSFAVFKVIFADEYWLAG
ncbi:hypothetical protein P9112_003570 [Eukaryota sp. TZLM1-RC]